jgi:type IV fimbrial biogenesis protein FimT
MVELMVTLGIIAVLAALAVPTLRGVMENSRIKATAQSLQNGLAMARAEAVRLNTRVAFTMDATGWSITRVDDNSLLQRASGRERAVGVAIAPDAVGAAVFDAFGRRFAGPTLIDVVATSPSGLPGYRPLRIQLTAGGTARLCDPAAAATEPKACL